MKYWGKTGAFWGGFWGILFGSAFFAIPGIGPFIAINEFMKSQMLVHGTLHLRGFSTISNYFRVDIPDGFSMAKA